MADPARKRATYADIEAAPPHVVAEIIDGTLYTHPRPSFRHGLAASALSVRLGQSFQFGGGGPGGWVFVDEPELHLRRHILVPDIAGWRRERLPGAPESSYTKIAPDWVCEVLSASTEIRDRTVKMRIYGKAGIPFLWIIDPRLQILETFENTGGSWTKAGDWNSDDTVRATPFDAVSFSLADLWPLDRPLGLDENPQHLYAGDR